MSLKVEWDKTNFYVVLDDMELELTRGEAESLFVVLGNGLQDQDLMKQEETKDEQDGSVLP